jgi:hypothetical protein
MQLFMKLQSNDFAWEMFGFSQIHITMFSLVERQALLCASQEFPWVIGLLECLEMLSSCR